jgi:hypothetical protein
MRKKDIRRHLVFYTCLPWMHVHASTLYLLLLYTIGTPSDLRRSLAATEELRGEVLCVVRVLKSEILKRAAAMSEELCLKLYITSPHSSAVLVLYPTLARPSRVVLSTNAPRCLHFNQDHVNKMIAEATIIS